VTKLVPDVLHPAPDGMPEAMLRSLALDGVLVRIDAGYQPIDVPTTPAVRAAAIAPRVPRELAPDGMIVAGPSAAWVWGGLPRLEEPLTIVVRGAGRMPAVDQPGAHLHRILLADAEIVALGEVLVTSPLRTVLDLLRGGRPDLEPAARILEAAGLSPAVAADALRARRRLPGRRRGLARAQLLLTR